MNKSLREYLNQEKKRVFQPDAYFAQRVVAKWNSEGRRATGFWELIPAAARPMLALGTTALLLFLSFEIFVPAAPGRGFVEAFLEPDQTAAESVLYTDADPPSSHELYEQLIVLEEGEQ